MVVKLIHLCLIWRKSEAPVPILRQLDQIIKSILTHSTGTPLHIIMITDHESKDQVSYHSLHWNSAPFHHDHWSEVQGSGKLSLTQLELRSMSLMITDQESKDQVSYHSLHWNTAPCHHDHWSGVQGSGKLSLTPLEHRSMSSWSLIRSPRIR